MHTCPAPSRRAIAAVMFGVVTSIVAFTAGFPARAQCSADPWADAVVASSWTATTPDRVLGAPDLVAANFEEEGSAPGFVTVSFGPDVIVDGFGDDFSVHVVDFAVSDWVEAFEVFVSPDDGATWVSLGVVEPTTTLANQPEELGFDLFGSGVDTVTQLRVVNTTVDAVNINEGPDLDAFQALNCAEAADGDLAACEDDLDACSTELVTCERELDEARDAAEQCAEDLDATLDAWEQCDTHLGEAEEALNHCEGDVGQAQHGLREIERLLHLPPPRRQSDYRCEEGETCEAVMRVIRMLVVPPGRGLHDKRRGR